MVAAAMLDQILQGVTQLAHAPGIALAQRLQLVDVKRFVGAVERAKPQV